MCRHHYLWHYSMRRSETRLPRDWDEAEAAAALAAPALDDVADVDVSGDAGDE